MSLVVALTGLADDELLTVATRVAGHAGWTVRTEVIAEGAGPEGAARVAELARGDDVDAVALGLGAPPAGPDVAMADSAARLIEGLRVPLLLVRRGMRPVQDLRRLLVPLEGSPSASEAMLRADQAFCARGREIVMLHVATGDTPGESGSMPAPRMMDQEHYDWGDWQKEFRMRFSQCPEGGRHRVSVRVGDPATMIVEEARSLDAELVALSWNGRLSSGRAETVRTVVEQSPCAVLLVPAPAPPAGS